MRYALGIVLLALAVGCQAPCIFCHTPESVLTSMEGQVGNLRIIEKDLVDALEDETLKAVWKNRLAAFITEARGTLAWAKTDGFDASAVLEEERKD